MGNQRETCDVCGSEDMDRFFNNVLRCFNCGYRPEYDNSIAHRIKVWWTSV